MPAIQEKPKDEVDQPKVTPQFLFSVNNAVNSVVAVEAPVEEKEEPVSHIHLQIPNYS